MMRWMAAMGMVLAACATGPAAPGPSAPGAEDELPAPALLANVPAEAPWVLASFQPIAPSYFARAERDFVPLLVQAWDFLRKQFKDPAEAHVADVLGDEVHRSWSVKGLTAMGFSTQPRFAAYGLGAGTVVIRLELLDEARVRANLDRIARAVNRALPWQERAGRAWFRIPRDGGNGGVLALADRQLVLALGRDAAIDAQLPLILGEARPARSLAGGGVLRELMARHHLGPVLIGFADTRQLVRERFARGGDCARWVEWLAAQAPRVVIGLDEVSGRQLAGGVVIELAPGPADALRALKTSPPGLAAALAVRAPDLFGAAFDLGRAQALGGDVAGKLHDAAEACGAPELAHGMARAGYAIDSAAPRLLAKLTGMVIAFQELGNLHELARGATPAGVEAFAMVTGDEMRPLAESMLAFAPPPVRQAILDAPGELRELPILPGVAIDAGYNDHALVFGMGAYGKQQGARALAAAKAAPVPLLALTLDYEKWFATSGLGDDDDDDDDGDDGDDGDDDDGERGDPWSASRRARAATASRDPMNRLGRDFAVKLFGRSTVAVDATSYGLLVRFALE